MVRDWMTVFMSSMGRGFCFISCCIITVSIFDVYTFRFVKYRLVVARRRRVGLFFLFSCFLGGGSLFFIESFRFIICSCDGRFSFDLLKF